MTPSPAGSVSQPRTSRTSMSRPSALTARRMTPRSPTAIPWCESSPENSASVLATISGPIPTGSPTVTARTGPDMSLLRRGSGFSDALEVGLSRYGAAHPTDTLGSRTSEMVQACHGGLGVADETALGHDRQTGPRPVHHLTSDGEGEDLVLYLDSAATDGLEHRSSDVASCRVEARDLGLLQDPAGGQTERAREPLGLAGVELADVPLDQCGSQ